MLALGGNALLRRNQPAETEAQRRNIERTASALAAIAEEHEVVITHGNDTQAGYMLELALRNSLPGRDVVTVLTQVLVGSGSGGFQRHVPSPEPRAIVGLPSLRVLVETGALLICAGGGGIPIAIDETATMHGVEAIVDKDLTAALLARRLDADLLLMLTDVDAVRLESGGEGERPLHSVHPEELREHDFATSSIGPKVEAACRFVEATGRRAAIGALIDATRLVRGSAGTQVAPRCDEAAIATVSS